jgi:hypothetical protein
MPELVNFQQGTNTNMEFVLSEVQPAAATSFGFQRNTGLRAAAASSNRPIRVL